MNVRNARYRDDTQPLLADCGCPACRHFSRGAIRHFVKSNEILGLELLTIHNLHFMLTLMRDIRASIAAGAFDAFRRAFHASADADRPVGAEIRATHLVPCSR
jgi:queuine tRNA-ribosyltransferase